MLQPLSEYLFTGRFALAVGLGGFVTCIISIPAPLFKRGGHFVASFLQFCCRWRENRAPASSSGLRPPFWGLLFDTPTRDAVTGPSSRSPIGLLLRRDRRKGEDSLEVEPLVSRVRVMVLRPVWAYQRGA